VKLNIKDVEKYIEEVEEPTKIIEDIVFKIVNSISTSLDGFMDSLKSILDDVELPITDRELEESILKLSSILYYFNSSVEQTGIKSSITDLMNEDEFNTKFLELTGTLQDRNIKAKIESQLSNVRSIIFKKVYIILKNKYSSGLEMLGSLKKILSSRMLERDLNNGGE